MKMLLGSEVLCRRGCQHLLFNGFPSFLEGLILRLPRYIFEWFSIFPRGFYIGGTKIHFSMFFYVSYTVLYLETFWKIDAGVHKYTYIYIYTYIHMYIYIYVYARGLDLPLRHQFCPPSWNIPGRFSEWTDKEIIEKSMRNQRDPSWRISCRRP